MRKVELELESLKIRMFAAEQEIEKLKFENQNLRIDNERILNQMEQLRNIPPLSVENVLKLNSIHNSFDLIKNGFSTISNIDLPMGNPTIHVSAKFGKNGEDPCFFDYKEPKMHESNFNCDSSLCIKTINNTNLNTASKNENEEEEKPVFKTLTGDKYHNENCKHLERSRIKISLQQAIKNKMKACKVCAPDLF